MAIGVYVAPVSMSDAQYKECIKLLRKAGVAHPAGRSYHASFGPKDKLAVFDVWSSQAAFDKFGKVLMPILQQLGVETAGMNVMPINSVIVPPAKAAKKPAAKKRGKVAARGKKR